MENGFQSHYLRQSPKCTCMSQTLLLNNCVLDFRYPLDFWTKTHCLKLLWLEGGVIGQKQIWNLCPCFAYLQYNFYGAPMMIRTVCKRIFFYDGESILLQSNKWSRPTKYGVHGGASIGIGGNPFVRFYYTRHHADGALLIYPFSLAVRYWYSANRHMFLTICITLGFWSQPVLQKSDEIYSLKRRL